MGKGASPVVDVGAYERQPWVNVGLGLSAYGAEWWLLPQLAFTAGFETRLALTHAVPFGIGVLVVGSVNGNYPIKGGILVPEPQFAQMFANDAQGGAIFAGVLPADAVVGASVYFQVWGPVDGAWSATNALMGTVEL